MLQKSENSRKMSARLELDDLDPNQTMAPELSFNVTEPAGNKDVLSLKVNIIVQVYPKDLAAYLSLTK
jgi:hypothetical protein